MTIKIDSFSFVKTDQNKVLKVIHAAYTRPYEYPQPITFIEKIGGAGFIIPYPSVGFICDGDGVYGLRCYNDTAIGFYTTDTSKPCDYTAGIEKLGSPVFKIYPNPASDNFEIQLDGDENTKGILCDITGRVILQTTFRNKVEMDLAGLQNGLYILTLNQNEKVFSSMVIKE